MRAALARAFIALAAACLGNTRRDWALAMQGELEAAAEDGRPVAFAIGCLVAAWHDMPRHEEGRFVLANHALALGVILPLAALQFACATGLPFLLPAADMLARAPVPEGTGALYLAGSYLAAEPALLGLWLLLCLLHLRLAWALLDGDWPLVMRTGAMAAAATVTLLISTGVMLLADARVVVQALALPVELAAVVASAQWHARLAARPLPEGSGPLAS